MLTEGCAIDEQIASLLHSDMIAPISAATANANVIGATQLCDYSTLSSPNCLTVAGHALWAQLIMTTAGGTPSSYLHYSIATSGGDSQFVKASPGNLGTITVSQSTTTPMELKLYNSSSAPTCSSATNIVDNIPIPSNTILGGYHITYPNGGRQFSNGISFCIVAFGAPASSTDSGTPAVGVVLSMTYE